MFTKQGGKFIYAFSEEDANVLLARGFRLIKKQESLGIYVFENDASLMKEFVFGNRNIWTSDTLSF